MIFQSGAHQRCMCCRTLKNHQIWQKFGKKWRKVWFNLPSTYFSGDLMTWKSDFGYPFCQEQVFTAFFLKFLPIIFHSSVDTNMAKIWGKMKKILVQIAFITILLHWGFAEPKNPNFGYISRYTPSLILKNWTTKLLSRFSFIAWHNICMHPCLNSYDYHLN